MRVVCNDNQIKIHEVLIQTRTFLRLRSAILFNEDCGGRMISYDWSIGWIHVGNTKGCLLLLSVLLLSVLFVISSLPSSLRLRLPLVIQSSLTTSSFLSNSNSCTHMKSQWQVCRLFSNLGKRQSSPSILSESSSDIHYV